MNEFVVCNVDVLRIERNFEVKFAFVALCPKNKRKLLPGLLKCFIGVKVISIEGSEIVFLILKGQKRLSCLENSQPLMIKAKLHLRSLPSCLTLFKAFLCLQLFLFLLNPRQLHFLRLVVQQRLQLTGLLGDLENLTKIVN
jgi:hypothetical protein